MDRVIKIIQLLSLLFAWVTNCGCFLNKTVIGKYSTPKNANIFEINADSTFKYEYRAFHLYRYSSGYWKLDGYGKLILNSYFKNDKVLSEIYNIDKRKDIDIQKVKIQLKIENGLPLINYRCCVYNDKKLIINTRCDSLNALSIDPLIKNIQFKFFKQPLELVTDRIIESVNSDVIDLNTTIKYNIIINLSFDDRYFGYDIFDNYRLRYGHNKVLIYNSLKKKWDKIPKVADKSQIFSDFK